MMSVMLGSVCKIMIRLTGEKNLTRCTLLYVLYYTVLIYFPLIDRFSSQFLRNIFRFIFDIFSSSSMDNNFVHLVNNSITKDHKEFHDKVRTSVCVPFQGNTVELIIY
jgi:hypothetical protein